MVLAVFVFLSLLKSGLLHSSSHANVNVDVNNFVDINIEDRGGNSGSGTQLGSQGAGTRLGINGGCQQDCCEGEGYFFFPLTGQCFKYLDDQKRNWPDAENACDAEGLTLAFVIFPVELRKFMVSLVGGLIDGSIASECWVGATRLGADFQWIFRNNKPIMRKDNPWWFNPNGGGDCLHLMVNTGRMADDPDKPFFSSDCYQTLYTLCERTASPKAPDDLCPEDEGFFKMPRPSNKCYRLFDNNRLNFDNAKKLCAWHGLSLARVYSAIELRSYLVQRYGGIWKGDVQNNPTPARIWLNARGDGSQMLWSDGVPISNRSPLFFRNSGSTTMSTDTCLVLLTNYADLGAQPVSPYWPTSCDYKFFPLCEKI